MSDAAKILIVDDEPVNRLVLDRMMAKLGHVPLHADSGVTGLEQVNANNPDMILLDLHMPEMDGYEMLTRLKANPLHRRIPVIIISSSADIENVARGIEMGADDFMPKPFNRTILQARLNGCLERKRAADRELRYLQQIEREKQRADDLLHVILPDPIVDELKETNVVAPRRHENVAVMFCDVVGFTEYCDHRQPEEVLPVLQDLVVAYEQAAVRNGVQKLKTIGDAFMAAAGLLVPVDSPVLACVACGLEMIAATKALPTGWQVRIGIHAGPVVAGVLGSNQYLYDLWGDTVNTASRIERHGRANAIALSAAAWAQIADRCVGQTLGYADVKGKGRLEVIQFMGMIEVPAKAADQVRATVS